MIYFFLLQDDVHRVLGGMGNLNKLSPNDDIKIDWDEKHLVRIPKRWTIPAENY